MPTPRAPRASRADVVLDPETVATIATERSGSEWAPGPMAARWVAVRLAAPLRAAQAAHLGIAPGPGRGDDPDASPGADQQDASPEGLLLATRTAFAPWLLRAARDGSVSLSLTHPDRPTGLGWDPDLEEEPSDEARAEVRAVLHAVTPYFASATWRID